MCFTFLARVLSLHRTESRIPRSQTKSRHSYGYTYEPGTVLSSLKSNVKLSGLSIQCKCNPSVEKTDTIHRRPGSSTHGSDV